MSLIYTSLNFKRQLDPRLNLAIHHKNEAVNIFAAFEMLLLYIKSVQVAKKQEKKLCW
jgi:hypothetical protein